MLFDGRSGAQFGEGTGVLLLLPVLVPSYSVTPRLTPREQKRALRTPNTKLPVLTN
jgi:hypothetical protein